MAGGAGGAAQMTLLSYLTDIESNPTPAGDIGDGSLHDVR